MMVWRLFLAVLWGGLRFVIVVFPDHTHYFYEISNNVVFAIGNDCDQPEHTRSLITEFASRLNILHVLS